MNLLSSMKYLCDDTRMLAGLTAAYGTESSSEHALYGRAQELRQTADGVFVPDIRPLKDDSIYDLASLTKLFTSVITMQLVSCGRLSLDETIRSIDPRFSHLGETTVYEVLSFNAVLQTPGRIDSAPSREEALRRLFDVQRVDAPRIRFYSDINAMVMKYIVEAKTGMAFSDALARYILAPAGLTQTYAQVPKSVFHRCVCYNYEHRIAAGQYILRTDTLPGIAHDPKAAFLSENGRDLCGHAGLFSTRSDMIRFAQALLSEELLSLDMLLQIGVNRTGLAYADGTHRQYLGYLCFTKHPNQYLSEVPVWMGEYAFGLSGFTGNHLSIDPVKKRFVLFLGNRCHGRVSHIQMTGDETYVHYGLAENGTGAITWPDGRCVPSSARYVHFKDERLHAPIQARMRTLGWF